MSKTSIPNAPLPFDELAEAIKGRRSVYGLISGLRLDRAAPGEAWSSLPYRPVFVGDTETGVLHGGVVTAMLDESCGMAVQLALDGTRAIPRSTAHRLSEARDAGPRHRGAFGLLPRHPLDRFRALDGLPGIRRRSGRHGNGLLHGWCEPDQPC